MLKDTVERTKPNDNDRSRQSDNDRERNRRTLKLVRISNGYTVSDHTGAIHAFTGEDAKGDMLDFIDDVFDRQDEQSKSPSNKGK